MQGRFRETVWGLDPRWKRVEYLDEQGNSLGVVRFEYQPDQTLRQPGKSKPRHGRLPLYAAILGLAITITAIGTFVLAAM